MQQSGPDQPDTTVDEPHKDAGEEEYLELFPVTPASANVKHGQDVMCLAKEFVAGKSDGPRCGKGNKQKEEEHCNACPDHVRLDEQVPRDLWLRLVEPCLDKDPSQRVQGSLCEDDVSEPSVEEVEALVRQPSDERQDGLSARQHDGERRERVSEDAHTIRPGTESCARVVDAGRVLDWCNPFSVNHSHEGEDGQISGQNEECQDLCPGDSSEDESGGIRQQVLPRVGWNRLLQPLPRATFFLDLFSSLEWNLHARWLRV